MDSSLGNIEILHNHFDAPAASDGNLDQRDSSKTNGSFSSHSHPRAVRKARTVVSLLKSLSLRHLPWASGKDCNDKIELNFAELQSLKSEIADAEEREAYLKAQLEHVDEILRTASLAGYLHVRTRWTELPGEPPILDDTDVDDWLPRFVVLHGICIFYYFRSTDMSPQDTTLLSNVVEVDLLPTFTQDQQERHAFYILTCHGLRFECSSLSKFQVDSWLAALRAGCNLGEAES